MANATGRHALAQVQAKAVHAGVNAVRLDFVASASHSAIDIVTMGQIPHGAVYDDVILLDTLPPGATSLPSVTNLTLGVTGAANKFLSVSLNTLVLTRATGGLGYQVSLSDAAPAMYETINAVFGTTHVQSVGQGFSILVKYHL